MIQDLKRPKHPKTMKVMTTIMITIIPISMGPF